MITPQPAFFYLFTLLELLELATLSDGEEGKHSREVATRSDRIVSVMIVSGQE